MKLQKFQLNREFQKNMKKISSCTDGKFFISQSLNNSRSASVLNPSSAFPAREIYGGGSSLSPKGIQTLDLQNEIEMKHLQKYKEKKQQIKANDKYKKPQYAKGASKLSLVPPHIHTQATAASLSELTTPNSSSSSITTKNSRKNKGDKKLKPPLHIKNQTHTKNTYTHTKDVVKASDPISKISFSTTPKNLKSISTGIKLHKFKNSQQMARIAKLQNEVLESVQPSVNQISRNNIQIIDHLLPSKKSIDKITLIDLSPNHHSRNSPGFVNKFQLSLSKSIKSNIQNQNQSYNQNRNHQNVRDTDSRMQQKGVKLHKHPQQYIQIDTIPKENIDPFARFEKFKIEKLKHSHSFSDPPCLNQFSNTYPCGESFPSFHKFNIPGSKYKHSHAVQLENLLSDRLKSIQNPFKIAKSKHPQNINTNSNTIIQYSPSSPYQSSFNSNNSLIECPDSNPKQHDISTSKEISLENKTKEEDEFLALQNPMNEEKLAIFNDTFQQIIERDQNYGFLLKKIKNAYSEYLNSNESTRRVDSQAQNELELKAQVDKNEIEISELRRERDTLLKKIEETRNENKKIREENANRLTELLEKNKQITKLDEERRDFESKSLEMEKDILKLEEKIKEESKEKGRELKKLKKASSETEESLQHYQNELTYYKQRENKLMYLLYTLQKRGYPVQTIFENEIKDIPTSRFTECFNDDSSSPLNNTHTSPQQNPINSNLHHHNLSHNDSKSNAKARGAHWNAIKKNRKLPWTPPFKKNRNRVIDILSESEPKLRTDSLDSDVSDDSLLALPVKISKKPENVPTLNFEAIPQYTSIESEFESAQLNSNLTEENYNQSLKYIEDFYKKYQIFNPVPTQEQEYHSPPHNVEQYEYDEEIKENLKEEGEGKKRRINQPNTANHVSSCNLSRGDSSDCGEGEQHHKLSESDSRYRQPVGSMNSKSSLFSVKKNSEEDLLTEPYCLTDKSLGSQNQSQNYSQTVSRNQSFNFSNGVKDNLQNDTDQKQK